MVKSTAQSAPDHPAFPCLMRSLEKDLVVLFRAQSKGVVVSSVDTSFYGLGDFSSTWAMNSFEPFHGTVTLEA